MQQLFNLQQQHLSKIYPCICGHTSYHLIKIAQLYNCMFEVRICINCMLSSKEPSLIKKLLQLLTNWCNIFLEKLTIFIELLISTSKSVDSHVTSNYFALKRIKREKGPTPIKGDIILLLVSWVQKRLDWHNIVQPKVDATAYTAKQAQHSCF